MDWRLLTLLSFVSFVDYASASPSSQAPSPFSALERRADDVCPGDGVQWDYVGCFTDKTTQRTFTGSYLSRGDMTNDICKSHCEQAGYLYAGTEWGQECFCGTSVQNGGVSTNAADCSKPCAGNSGESCGNGDRLSAWKQRTVYFEEYDGWIALGCFVDNVNNRIISTQANVQSNTPGNCLEACKNLGHSFAGLEYGQECWCGSSTSQAINSLTKVDYEQCNFVCSGDKRYVCGAGDRMILYQDQSSSGGGGGGGVVQPPPSNDWESKGCYTDQVWNRALPFDVSSSISGGMTINKCIAECSNRGYSFAGLEYAKECFCGNSIGSSGSLANSGCNMKCSGDSSAFCGGPDRLTLYQKPNSGPTALASYNNWTHKGCYVDNVLARALPKQRNVSPMTPQNCLNSCQNAGYKYAGLEYAQECFCGQTLSSQKANDGCTMPCAGDQSHLCGGGNRLNVYERA